MKLNQPKPMTRKSSIRSGWLSLAGFVSAIVVSVAQAAPAAWADAGSVAEGYQRGRLNGQRIVEMVKRQTVDENGCRAIGRFQDALLTVTQNVRPRANNPGADDDLVRGFYQGYVQSIREGIYQVRRECRRAGYRNGRYPGRFAGAVFCRLNEDLPGAVGAFPFEPIYENWAVGNAAREGCEYAFVNSVNDCAGERAVDQSVVIRQTVCR